MRHIHAFVHRMTHRATAAGMVLLSALAVQALLPAKQPRPYSGPACKPELNARPSNPVVPRRQPVTEFPYPVGWRRDMLTSVPAGAGERCCR